MSFHPDSPIPSGSSSASVSSGSPVVPLYFRLRGGPRIPATPGRHLNTELFPYLAEEFDAAALEPDFFNSDSDTSDSTYHTTESPLPGRFDWEPYRREVSPAPSSPSTTDIFGYEAISPSPSVGSPLSSHTPVTLARSRSPSPSDQLVPYTPQESPADTPATVMADVQPTAGLPVVSGNSSVNFGSIPVLQTSDDWTRWSRMVRDCILLAGYGELLVDNDIGGQDHLRSLHARACAAMRTRCGYNAWTLIEDCITVPTALATLEDEFKPRGPGTFAILCQRFEEISLAQCKDVTDYVEQFRMVLNELRTLDKSLVFPGSFLVQKFLHGLGPSYNIFRTTFNQTRNILPEGNTPAISFDLTARAAIAEERTLNSQEEIKAYQAKHSRGSIQAFKATAGKNQVLEAVDICSHCGKRYHTKDNCFELHPALKEAHQKKKEDKKRKAKENKGQGGDKKSKTKNKDDSDDEPPSTNAFLSRMTTFMARTSAADLSDAWAIDSACNQHITDRRSAFVQYTPYKQMGPVTGIGGVELIPLGYGTVKLICNVNGKPEPLLIQNVVHCTGVGANLLSVSQFRAAGVRVTEFFGLQKGNSPRFTSSERGGLYFLDLWKHELPATIPEPEMKAYASLGLSTPQVHLWHERMGHLGEKNLRKLQDMATGINLDQPLVNVCTCEPCVYGRMKENPHKGNIEPGRYPLELIHTDLAGPFPIPGYAGQRYWMTFLDDYTKISEVEALIRKNEAFRALKRYLARHEHPARRCQRIRVVRHQAQCPWINFDDCTPVGNIDTIASDGTPDELHRQCHRLRMDGGGEYSSDEMKTWLLDTGIVAEVTTADQHQQNGASESLNRVLMDKLHPMLLAAGLHRKWWPEALKCANYLRNRSPTSGLDCTPYEMWFKEKPDLSHIRTFGAWAYVLKTEAKRKKLKDAKATLCKLVGYEGARIFRLVTAEGKIVRSSNVHFQAVKKQIEAPPPPPSPPAQKKPRLEAEAVGVVSRGNIEYVGASRPEASSSVEGEGFVLEGPIMPTDDKATASTDDQNLDPPLNTAEGEPEETAAVEETAPVQGNSTLSSHPELRPLQTPKNWVSSRENKGQNPHRVNRYALLASATSTEPYEPRTIREARQDYAWLKWQQAMKEEHDQLLTNDTWELVQPPKGRHVLSGKWVYKLKRGAHGEILRYKARWVVRGFEQREGIDFNETFATVVKPMSYKALFALAAALDLEIEQMDVKTAFLYGQITEEIYVQQPTGLEDGTERVCKLRRALYGLKQAPRVWYNTLTDFLKDLGFISLIADLSVYCRGHVFVAIFVDDLLIFGPSMDEINKLKKKLNKRFQMSDLGPAAYYLGMEITRDRPNRTIYLNQTGYLEKILKDFGLWDVKPVTTPMDTSVHLVKADEGFQASDHERTRYQSAVGSLMYAMMGTRADVAFAVSVISRFASNPDDSHWKACKRVFRYLRGSLEYNLTFSGPLQPLVGYTDADWAGDHDTRRSTSGFTFSLGSGVISWQSKRQPTVALSSCEAEYMGQTQATKEAIWLRKLLSQLDESYEEPAATVIFGDNQGAIALAKNPEFHARTKHIDIQHHFVRERVASGEVTMRFVPTSDQIADGLTKALCRDKFETFRRALGLELPRRITTSK